MSAKLGFGSCPTVPMKTWDDYTHVSTGFAKDQFYYHEFIAIDSQLLWLLELAKKFGLNLLDIKALTCADLATIDWDSK